MTTIADIASYLDESGQVRRLVADGDPAAQPVNGVTTDTGAEAGELAWTRRHQSWWTFRGSLLLAPPADPDLEDPYPVRAGRTVIECENPRLAVALVVERFYAHLAVDREPEFAEPVMAEEVRRLGAWVMNARLGAGVLLGPRVIIGCGGMGYERERDGRWVRFPQLGGVVVEDDVHIAGQAMIQRGALGDTVLRRGSRIGPMVNVGHNVEVGEDVLVAGHAQIGGGAHIGRGALIWQSAVVANGVHVGEGAVIGMSAAIRKDVPAGEVWAGNPARKLR